jgi:hypothetical protein
MAVTNMVLNRLHMAAVHTAVVVPTGAVDMVDRPSMDNPNTVHIRRNKAMDLDIDPALATVLATAGDMVEGMETVINSRLHPEGMVLVQRAVPR